MATVLQFGRHVGFFGKFCKILRTMLSLGSDSNTQDYTCDPDLLQESLAGKFPQFITITHTCDKCSKPIHLSDK